MAIIGLNDGSSTPSLPPPEVKFPRNTRLSNRHSLLKLLGSQDLKTLMEATHTAERAVSGIQDALFGADNCEPAEDESSEEASHALEDFERELDQIAESAHYLIELMSNLRNDGSSPSVDSESPSIVSELAHLKDFEDLVHLEIEEAEENFSANGRHTVPSTISVCSIHFRGDSARQDYACNDDLTGFYPTSERTAEPFEKNGACHPCSRLGANRSPLIMPGFPVAQCEPSQPPPDKSTSGVHRVIRIPIMTSSKITGSSSMNSDSEAKVEFEIFRVVQTPVLVSFSSLASWGYLHELNDRSEQPVFQSMLDPSLNTPGSLALNNDVQPKLPMKGNACSCVQHCGGSDEETIDAMTESSSSGSFDSY